MKSLFQCNWYIEVGRSPNGQLKAKTSYLDTQREAAAHLLVDIKTFIIKDAWLEEQRTRDYYGSESRQVTPLLGSEAYLGAGPTLKKTAAFLKDTLAVALFAEAIKGIIQSERFLLAERGYASLEEFFLMWRTSGLNSCCLYSNLDRVTFGKPDRGRDERPLGNLFVRFKTQNLYSLPGEEQYLLTGYFSDSRHETSVNLKLKGSTVLEAEGGFVRPPNPICSEADAFLANLPGLDLKGLSKKEIAAVLGNGQGCVHLIDLVNDCAQMLAYFKGL
ncbi:MAG TPA: DUF2889 domain-containing protein [Desulfitobacteriaceae bacterium]|jgi:hypothetical protein|nr:DUF2889 domain-containing protein [Desulfitobacteriaceae bacterium]